MENKSLNIVHISGTFLAGAPIRIVSLLRKHTKHNVRLIDLKRGKNYEHDIVYDESPEEAIELIKKADIIHIYNHIDFNAKFPVTMQELRSKGASFVRLFQSEPNKVASVTGLPVSEIVSSEIPTTVIAQYPERFFPKARVVPNVILPDSPEYLPSHTMLTNDIVYSPTIVPVSAWKARWNTKGAPETIKMLREVQKATGCKVNVVHSSPLSKVLLEKKRSRIIIDDLVTGSYHLSALEGLSQGKAVLTYIDQRIEFVLREITGAYHYPFINVRLEDAKNVLINLLNEPALIEEIGKNTRKWIENYWSEEILANHYSKVYDDLLNDPSSIKRQDELCINGPISKYYSMTLQDVIYNARAERYKLSLTIYDKIKILLKSVETSIRRWLLDNMPESMINSIRRIKGS